ncbi:MAG TPA: DUF692 family protein [Candidatus Dormibacteraeota bacterium]|nr:DUF692 family protein [Candidatus Dormibacteraeota bacterium]
MSFGLGFRPRYLGDLVDQRPPVDWLEIVSENFMGIGGRTRQMLLRLRADYPLVLHGVSLSIAGQEPLDRQHLERLRALADEVEPRFVTDHLTWTSWRGRESHDLLPVAYTEAVLAHVARRVEQVQEALGRRLYLENPTVYVAFAGNEMSEAEFLAALCRKSGCGVLLDVNNLFVNAANLGCDPAPYLTRLDPGCVAYFHVAGHAVLPDVRIDTHDAPVPDPVWALYERACAHFPEAGTVLERDDALPPFADLLRELEHARALHAAAPRVAAIAEPAAPVRQSASAAWPAMQEAFFSTVVGAAPAEGARALLASSAPVSAARGLAVYRDAYGVRLCRGLRQNFPALHHVLGDAEFAALIAAYVAAHPPRGYEFAPIGAQLAAFIPTHRFGAEFGVAPAVLADIAAVEQAELEVADAPDDGPPLTTAALAEVPPEAWPSLRVRATTALRLVHCGHDVLPVIEAVAAGRTPERPAVGERDYLICRPVVDIRRERLSATEVAVTRRLLDGATIEQACSGAELEVGATAVARLASLGVLRGLA